MGRVLSRVGVRVGIEDVAGTYQAPTDIVKVESVVLPNVEFDVVEIPNFSFFGGTSDVVTIADWGRANIEIQTSLYKSLSFYDKLLQICNLKKEAVTGGYKFTPDTHSNTTASIDLVLTDRKFKIKGAKSTFAMSGTVGDRIQVTFGTQGSYEERVIAPQTLVDSPSDEILVIRRLGGFTLNGVNLNLSEFNFQMGNELNYEKFVNIGEVHMSDYNPTISLTMRLEDGGDDGFDAFKNGDISEFVADIKDVDGNIVWQLKIPRAKVSAQPAFADSEGIFVITQEYKALSNDGDDNFEINYFEPVVQP